MTLTRQEALDRKAEAERTRAARMKKAGDLLNGLPDNDRNEVSRVAKRLMDEARARGERTASVAFLEQALTAHKVQADLAVLAKAERGEPALSVTIHVGDDTARTCPKCGETKPASEFSKHRTACRPCYNAAWKSWNDAKKAKATA